MADPKLDQLKRVPIFSRCSRSELETLARNTDEVTLQAGRTLIVEGEPNHTFYIVLSGEADVTIKEHSVTRLRAGDFFGEMTMLDRGPASATVVTASPVDALVMSHSQFRDAVRSNDNIAHNVIAIMAERLRQDRLAGY
jgi:protein phosphatase